MNEPNHKQHELGPDPVPIDGAAGHEMSDVSIGGLVTFLVGLVVSLAVVVFAIAWFFRILEMQAERRDRPPPPLADLRAKEAPAPRLQEWPTVEMDQLREAQDAALQQTQWIDKQQNLVQIPIDRAMRLVAKRLPDWPPVKEPDEKSPTENSSTPEAPEDRR